MVKPQDVVVFRSWPLRIATRLPARAPACGGARSCYNGGLTHGRTFCGARRAPTAGIRDTELGFPGAFPFTRGIQPTMYRGRLWTMRQYAGFGTAAESNQRYRYLLAQGVTGLSVAFDLPTQMGYDSDHPLAAGEVGRVGVAIDSIDDMAELFDGIPLDRVSTSMTINATAIILLVALRRGRAGGRASPTRALSGTIQNDILKEYVARGTYIYPPRASLRIVTDIFAFCERELPQLEHDLDQRLPHPRGGLDGGAGGRVHVRERDRLRGGGAATPGSTSTRSASASRSSSTRTTTSSRRSRSSARRGGCGRASCATASARRIRARSSCASTRRRRAARSPRSSRTTTSSAWRSRRWRRCSAARSRCTATAATRRWRCRPRNRRASRCARSRSSRPRPASPTPSIRSAASYAIEALTDEIEAGGARRCSIASTRPAARWRPSSRARSSARSRSRPTAPSRRSTPATTVVVGVNRFATDEARHDRGAADRSGDRAPAGRARAARVRAARDARAPAARRSTRSRTRRRADGQPRAADHRGGRSAGDGRAKSRTRCASVFGEHREIASSDDVARCSRSST